MLFNSEECEQLHNRNISVSTYIYDTDALAIEGRLIDNRFVDTFSLFGKFRPTGTVHDMMVQMVVRLPSFIIEDIQADMLTVPDSDCPSILVSLTAMRGKRIVSGFTHMVQQSVGGKKGCAHLAALIKAMGSAAVQGGYAMMARKPFKERKVTAENLETVLNSCHLWRSDGPMVKRLSQKIKEEI